VANFNNCIDFVLKHEGGILKDSTTGEYSNFGITQTLLGKINYFIKDPAQLTVNDAKNIYIQQFWQKYRLDLFTSDAIARKLLDMAVNMGPHQAFLLAQRALGYTGHMLDGILGHFTRAEIEQWPEARFLDALVLQCQGFYKQLAKDNPNDVKYLAGWLVRAGDV